MLKRKKNRTPTIIFHTFSSEKLKFKQLDRHNKDRFQQIITVFSGVLSSSHLRERITCGLQGITGGFLTLKNETIASRTCLFLKCSINLSVTSFTDIFTLSVLIFLDLSVFLSKAVSLSY